jgi:hypothetical protein
LAILPSKKEQQLLARDFACRAGAPPPAAAARPTSGGHADAGRLQHGRVRHRDVLQVDRADPLAAGLDHVLAAVGDLHEAVGVDGGHVAGREPAVHQHVAALVLEVAGDDPRPLHQQVAVGCAPSHGSSLPSSSTIFMSTP